MHWRGGVVIEREGMRERKERGERKRMAVAARGLRTARRAARALAHLEHAAPVTAGRGRSGSLALKVEPFREPTTTIH
ncbi:hypothetical protein EVAR_53091_1 [Eumeta japonica]|uniref:Uncharacterized protein n=1 Tax=Eumeta variegata TaxID=151549 RepID=A0A4C1ZDP2_EUMVA|nr:hypothetical protein EVAR_53091_1 [Eumeta japonica]